MVDSLVPNQQFILLNALLFDTVPLKVVSSFCGQIRLSEPLFQEELLCNIPQRKVILLEKFVMCHEDKDCPFRKRDFNAEQNNVVLKSYVNVL